MWEKPSEKRVLEVVETTWVPEKQWQQDGWVLRKGGAGGSRVSAATEVNLGANIEAAAEEMRKMSQDPLFMIRNQDQDLDHNLAERGYDVKDPVMIYAAPIKQILENSEVAHDVMESDIPLAVMADLWERGGIGAGRLNVMARVPVPKTILMARADDRAAGVAFVGCDRDIAMIHALEVDAGFRRRRIGQTLSAAAARWAQGQGAETLSLVTTVTNVAANTLYRGIGMQVVGRYHYRILRK